MIKVDENDPIGGKMHLKDHEFSRVDKTSSRNFDFFINNHVTEQNVLDVVRIEFAMMHWYD